MLAGVSAPRVSWLRRIAVLRRLRAGAIVGRGRYLSAARLHTVTTVHFKIGRGSEVRDVAVTLGELPSETEKISQQGQPATASAQPASSRFPVPAAVGQGNCKEIV